MLFQWTEKKCHLLDTMLDLTDTRMTSIEKYTGNKRHIESQNTDKHTSHREILKNKINEKIFNLHKNKLEPTLEETPDESFTSRMKKKMGNFA